MKIESQADILYHFDNFVNQISDPKLKEVCNELKGYKDYWTWPASVGHHHSFEGGLIMHTLEVATNALHTSKIFEQGNDDILLTASLWHDLAKIWEYNKVRCGNDMTDTFWEKGDYHGKVHHISGSTAEFTAIAIKHEVDREAIQKVQHCIIAHHGQKDWGSPRKPESIEAILLHQADMLSAMFPKNTHSVT
jgi:3'-5' exoribonuclease